MPSPEHREFRSLVKYRNSLDQRINKLKNAIHELLSRNRDISLSHRIGELNQYLRDWIGYSILEPRKSITSDLDKRTRRLLRACYGKRKRLPCIRISKWTALRISKVDALGFGNSRKRPDVDAANVSAATMLV